MLGKKVIIIITEKVMSFIASSLNLKPQNVWYSIYIVYHYVWYNIYIVYHCLYDVLVFCGKSYSHNKHIQ